MANVYGLIFEIDDKTKAGASSINRRLNSIADNAKRVRSAMRGVGSIAGTAVGALGKVAAGATAAAAAFGYLAKKNLDSLDALGKTADKLGVSTKFLSEYSFVANQAGLSTDQFQTGLQRFIRRLGQAQQGSGELLKPLKQLGINIKDSNGNFREGTDVFQEFIGKLGQTTNKSQQLALAMGAFDTEGVAFVNIAAMGAAEIANLRQEVIKAGGSIDERLTKAAADANDALGRLALRGKAFGLQFFGALSTQIETLADDITKALDDAVGNAGGMEAFAQNLAADFTSTAATLIRNLGIMFDGFRNTLNGAVNVVQRIIVAISKIPGSGFDAQIGDASGLNSQKSATKAAMAEQEALFDAAQEKVQRLRQELADLPSGWLGKKDPNNVAGQLTQAVYEANALGRELEQTKGELEALNNTFIFEELKTDYDGMTTSADKFAKKLEDQATALRENAKESARVNEIRQKYPYSEHTDAITRLAAGYTTLNGEVKTNNSTNDDAKDKIDELLPRLSAYQEFLNNITQKARTEGQEIGFAARAKAHFTAELEAGRMSLDVYARSMMTVNEILGINKDKEDENTNAKREATRVLDEYTIYLNDLIDASAREGRSTEYAIRAKSDLTKELEAGRISIDTYAAAMVALEGKLGDLGDEATETVAKIAPFQKFLNNITETAKREEQQIIFAAQAKSRLKAELDAGRMSLDTYARSMEIVNRLLGDMDKKSDEAADGISKIKSRQEEFQSYMRNLITLSQESAKQTEFEALAIAELDRQLRANLITLDAYAAARVRLGLVGSGKDDKDKPSGVKSTEIRTLSDLQKRMSEDSAKSANNMKIFQEYLALGKYSAEELQAAMGALGLTMDDLPYGAFKEVFTATTKAGIASTNNLKKLQGELNKLVEDGIQLTEVQQTMLDNINEQLGTETFDVAQKLEDQFKGMIGTVSNTFADVLLGLKDGFTSLEDLALQSLRMIISTLIEAIIRATILKQTVNFGGGGFFGSLLGGLGSLGLGTLIPGLGLLAGVGIAIGSRASGGPVQDGKSYMVGERGPELFRPNQSGTIVSNEELNSVRGEGDLSVNFTINAIDTQTGVEFLLENKRVITGVIQEAYMRRGAAGPMG